MDERDDIICRCEEVTRGDVLRAIAEGCRTVSSVKRATRAGMGACQGRTCGRVIRQILLSQGITDPEDLGPDKPRFPTVPCEMSCLEGEEQEDGVAGAKETTALSPANGICQEQKPMVREKTVPEVNPRADQYGAIVIGGGYFGCASAYFLAKAGVKTLMLEEKEISRGASGANFGNVQVQDASMGLSYALTLAGFARMKTMERELDSDIGYQPYPSLIAAEREEHLPALYHLYEEKRAAGLDIRLLEGAAVLEAEPNLAPGAVLAATWFEQGRIYPFHYLYALVRQGRRYGLEVQERAAVASLLLEGGACTGVMLADGRTLRAGHVVVAAGSGTSVICATAGLDVPVRSVKAEAFVTEAVAPFLRTYYSSAAFFGEAHSQSGASTSLCVGQSHYGNLLVAETTKPHGSVGQAYQDCTSIEHCRQLYGQLLQRFPALEKVGVLRSWVTASPYTETYEPCFGKSPVPGLILAAGFKSSAVVSALVGELVTGLVTRDDCGWDLSPFLTAVGRCAPAQPKA